MNPNAYRPFLLPGLLLVASLAVGGYLWALGSARQGELPVVSTGEADIGGPFSLIDQEGMRRSDADFHGRYMLVFFGFTYCPDICPTTLSILSAALKEIGPLSDKVVPILISVDPERDTPEMLKPYLLAFGPEFVGLTGTKEEVDAAVEAYHAYYQMVDTSAGDYTVNHSTFVYLMGPDGRYITHYNLDQGPDQIAEDLRRQIGQTR